MINKGIVNCSENKDTQIMQNNEKQIFYTDSLIAFQMRHNC